MRIETLENIEPGNPFLSDTENMGIAVDNRWTVMYRRHRDNTYIIIVDTQTGERTLIRSGKA